MTKPKLQGMTYKQLYIQLCEAVNILEEENNKLREMVADKSKYPHWYIEEIYNILGIVLTGLIDNRANVLGLPDPSQEEILVQEARARLYILMTGE